MPVQYVTNWRVLAFRLVVLDHAAMDVYLLTLVHSGSVEEARAADAWRWQRAENVQQVLREDSSTNQRLQGDRGLLAGTAHAACSPPSVVKSSQKEISIDVSSCSNGATSKQRELANGCYPGAPAPANKCGRTLAANGHNLRPPTSMHVSPAMNGHSRDSGGKAFHLHHPRLAYINNVQACKDALYAGESYELCLTTALSRPAPTDPLQLYYTLRRRSPAPYAAFLSFGATGPHVRLPTFQLLLAVPFPCVQVTTAPILVASGILI